MKLHHRLCILAYIHLCSQSKLTLRMRLTGVNSSLIIWKYWWNGRRDHFIWLLNLAILAPSEITPQVVYSSYIHLCSQSELTLRMRLTGVDSSLTTWQLNFSSSQHNFLILLMVREMIPIHNGVSTLFEVTLKKLCVPGLVGAAVRTYHMICISARLTKFLLFCQVFTWKGLF